MSFSTTTSTSNTACSNTVSPSSSKPGYKKQSDDAFDMMALTDLIEFDSDSDVDMLDFFDTESSFSNLPGEGGDLLPSDDLLAELESIDEHMSAPSSLCEYHNDTNDTTANNSSTSSLSYSEVEKKLEESMRRSSLTRERIAAFRQQEQHQYHQSCTSNASFVSTNNNSSIPEIKVDLNQPLKPQTVASCAAFLMGSRPTLTTALEQSRKQLQEYMASLNQGSAM